MLIKTDRESVPRPTVEPSPGRTLQARVPVYKGRFGRKEAERLLWRAGFGPKHGEAQKLARLGMTRAVDSLVYPPKEKLTGPKPRDDDGRRLAPKDAWGHDGLWWLDRMVRTRRPLVERMTLVWHDWFATSNGSVNSPAFMLRQNGLFRKRALGSFQKLLLDVTRDPAMLMFLSGIYSTRESPNENYGRELMELFALGAGNGYTEEDVREQARALTGWTADWREGRGYVDFRFSANSTTAARRRSLERADATTGRTPATCASSIPHTPASSSRSSGATSSPRRRARRRRARSCGCTARVATRFDRSCARFSGTPTSTRGLAW